MDSLYNPDAAQELKDEVSQRPQSCLKCLATNAGSAGGSTPK
jgi:hypothetical protein